MAGVDCILREKGPGMTEKSKQNLKMFLIPCSCGTTFAYALLLSGLAAEIALIDVNRAKAEGEAMDLNHAVPFSHPTKIWAGDFPDCAQAAVVVMAAGANQKPGETRLDLIYKNATIW